MDFDGDFFGIDWFAKLAPRLLYDTPGVDLDPTQPPGIPAKPLPRLLYDTPGIDLDPTVHDAAHGKPLPLFLHDTPRITMALANDTGVSSTDRLTADATIEGWFSDAGAITAFQLAIDQGAHDHFIDATTAVGPDGRFVLGDDLLDAASGPGGLADGHHTINVRGVGDNGRVTTAQFAFTLDTGLPDIGNITLDCDSDTGHRNDGRTQTAIVDLDGWAEAFATVAVAVAGIETTVLDNGRFTIDDLPLDPGTHDYTITVADKAGNTSTQILTLTRLEDSVVNCNDIALEAIQTASTVGIAALYAKGSMAMADAAITCWQAKYWFLPITHEGMN